MGLDCRARIIVGIPVDRQDFCTFEEVGTYTCPSGHDFKKKAAYCSKCGKPLDAITKIVFTDVFLDYCKSIKKAPGEVIETWEDEWDDTVLRFHNADEIARNAGAHNEVLGICILKTESHRSALQGGLLCLDQGAVDLAFKEMIKLGKHFYSDFDVGLYLSLNVSA